MAHRRRRNADEALAVAIASGQTLLDAARSADVEERTAAQRWADASFRRRVAALRSEMVACSLGRMADGMAEAADTLRQLLQAEGESVRLGAARSILELGNKLRESVELEQQIQELQGRVDELRGSDGLR
jgi:hypothetical protein